MITRKALLGLAWIGVAQAAVIFGNQPRAEAKVTRPMIELAAGAYADGEEVGILGEIEVEGQYTRKAGFKIELESVGVPEGGGELEVPVVELKVTPYELDQGMGDGTKLRFFSGEYVRQFEIGLKDKVTVRLVGIEVSAGTRDLSGDAGGELEARLRPFVTFAADMLGFSTLETLDSAGGHTFSGTGLAKVSLEGGLVAALARNTELKMIVGGFADMAIGAGDQGDSASLMSETYAKLEVEREGLKRSYLAFLKAEYERLDLFTGSISGNSMVIDSGSAFYSGSELALKVGVGVKF